MSEESTNREKAERLAKDFFHEKRELAVAYAVLALADEVKELRELLESKRMS